MTGNCRLLLCLTAATILLAAHPVIGAETHPADGHSPAPATAADHAAADHGTAPLPTPAAQAAPASEGARLEQIRFHEKLNVPRIVLDLTGPVGAKIRPDPEHPVIELAGLAPVTTESTFAGTSSVTGVHVAPGTDGTVALTLDLKTPADLSVYPIAPDAYGGHRLVIELHPPEAGCCVTGKSPPAAEAHAAPPAASAPSEPAVPAAPTPTAVSFIPADDLAAVRAEAAMERGEVDLACCIVGSNYPADSWNMRAMVMRAKCLEMQGKRAEGLGVLRRLLDFDPEYAQARLLLADMLSRAGDTTGARDHYTRVLSTNPPSEIATEILARLQTGAPALPSLDLDITGGSTSSGPKQIAGAAPAGARTDTAPATSPAPSALH